MPRVPRVGDLDPYPLKDPGSPLAEAGGPVPVQDADLADPLPKLPQALLRKGRRRRNRIAGGLFGVGAQDVLLPLGRKLRRQFMIVAPTR